MIKKSGFLSAVAGFTLSVAVLSSSTMFSSQQAHAQIPVTDIGSLMQMVMDGIMREMEAQIMQSLEEAGIDQAAVNSEMEVDAINNGFGNMIARMGRASQDIQNLEQLEKATPAKDVCDTVQLSAGLDDMLCSMDSQVAEFNAQNMPVHQMTAGTGKYLKCDGKNCTVADGYASVEDVSAFNATEARKIITLCDRLTALLGGKNPCLRADLNYAPPPQGLTKDEYQGVLAANKLAVGPMIDTPRANAQTAKLAGTPAHDKMVAADMRDTYFRGSLEAALNNHTMVVHGTLVNDERGMGDMLNLEKYLQTRLGSQNWLCEVTNSCAEAGSNEHGDLYVPPEELEKRKAQMDAVGLYMSLQQYKSSLRVERLLADLALMELDPPKK